MAAGEATTTVAAGDLRLPRRTACVPRDPPENLPPLLVPPAGYPRVPPPLTALPPGDAASSSSVSSVSERAVTGISQSSGGAGDFFGWLLPLLPAARELKPPSAPARCLCRSRACCSNASVLFGRLGIAFKRPELEWFVNAPPHSRSVCLCPLPPLDSSVVPGSLLLPCIFFGIAMLIDLLA
ncbi:LOW QUALITY PROTEIN: hypothetical protein GQ55_9G060000 [Panicum hallii var. hallii]|uniref:Uncharacterized protein n=1 Tax=Panicum hallii var. hallii TaxID=1504633 RepID=A0A2T7C038_9POAL|nr:LOW QUALITY PROTEIN: hypothetical protein GQ55_9G060000 [Panicum hallii var. hallii]